MFYLRSVIFFMKTAFVFFFLQILDGLEGDKSNLLALACLGF